MAPNADVVSPDGKPSTTTMSLIGVRSGRDTTIVIAMLKSLGYLELRIDEMHPRLLDFGNDTESAGRLLYGHRDLITKLRSKQDQVEQLLAGADKLVTEQKTEDGVIVYEAMAESLGVAWRELNRQLDLRGYILEDTLRFYDHANKHAQAIGSIHNLLRAAAASGDLQAIANAQAGFNHLLDITAFTVDLGASIIRQIRVLGSLADNAERPAETANACLAIEHVLLKLSQEWETIETVWNDEKERLGSVQLQQAPSQASAPSPRIDAKLADQLNSVETWLRHAHSDIAHGQTDQDTLNRLTAEGRQQREYLGTLIAQAEAQNSEVLVVRGRELQNAVSTFLKSLEERSQLSNRIKTFLSNADTILSQLDKMEQDLSNASAAIAGELAPLAKQKTSAVIDEGQQILSVRRSIQVSDKLVQLTGRLSQIEKLARNRIQYGNKILKTQITSLTTWLKDVAEPFLASNGNVGGDAQSSSEFVSAHRQFIQEVVNKEQEVNTLLNRAHELSTEDRRQLSDFEQRYENLKQTLAARSELGHNFQQVQRFSQELESSFQTLSNLFDSNRDFSNHAVSEQMSHVFTVVSDTLAQERDQANQFINDAKTLAAHDVHLNTDAAIDAVRANVIRHEETLEEVRQKWQNWERAVVETRTATKTIEEVQMWQVDTFEVIRTLEDAADRAHTIEQKEHVHEKAEEVLREVPVQQQKLDEAHRIVTEKQNEQSRLNIQRAAQPHRQPERRVNETQKSVTEQQSEIRRVNVERAPEPQQPQPRLDESRKTITEQQSEQSRVNIQQAPQPQPRYDETHKTITEQQSEQTRYNIQQTPQPQPRLDETHKTVTEQQSEQSRLNIQHAPQPPPRDETHRTVTEQQSEQSRLNIQHTPQPQPEPENRVKTITEKQNEESLLNIQRATQTQKDIENRLKAVQSKVTTTQTVETFHQHDSHQIRQSAPRLVTELHDAAVDEGARFEFAARVEAEPEPKIKWTKDGIDIQSNVDYRQKFINGVATLSIEETFIEDSAVYTLRVENPLGSAESSARLTVKSKSALGGRLDEAKPRFVKQLNNVTVTEGETARLDTVVIAVPEPKVTWYKEETLIQEDERIKLEFRGDNVSLIINSAQPTDTGLYKVSAKNEVGETTNFAKIHVAPRKVPPPTAPKPKTPIPEAPAFSPSLVNQTITEGETAVFQVRTIGSPPPKVTWKFKEAPVTTSKTVKVEEESNGWSKLSIENASAANTGLYTVEAINESGIARSGATLIVAPVDNTPRHGIQQRSVTMIQSEGFWSDGAYTAGTPTPPPVPQHKIVTTNIEEFHQQDASEVGFSSIANAPDFVRPFQSEYTINEGEKAQIECLLVANPRPKVHWYFNDAPIKSNWQFAEFTNIGDTYSIVLTPAKLENAGYYRMEAENIKGKAVTNTVIHVRPRSLIPQPTTKPRKPHTIEHQRVYETFGAVDYNEIVPKPSQIPQKHAPSTRVTPPPAKRVHAPETVHSIQTTQLHESGAYTAERQRQATNQQYGSYEASSGTGIGGTPPHFVQTLVSSVTTVGESAKFEGIVTGAPAPEIIWTKDGVTISKQTHPHLEFSNIGGRISLSFPSTDLPDSGKYMCSAKNASGVATSSAQLVVRAKTVAPDFIKRLISEEIVEGERLRWTVRVTGDPAPKVTWLRDGIVIPNCPEVQLVDEGAGHHTMIIDKVQLVDSGQFTCLAENSAGEARSTADLVVRPAGAEPGAFFHVTKVTQERQVKGEEVSRNQTFSIENPRATPTRQ